MRSARAAHCPPLSRPHNLHYVGNARRTGLIAPRGRRCAASSIAKADKISAVTSTALALRSVLPLSRLSRSVSLPIADLVLACVGCTRDTLIYGEKRTSGSATTRRNTLRENPRLSDDDIRGNPPLHYDDASDAGVGAKWLLRVSNPGVEQSGCAVALPGGANIADPTSPTGLLMSPVSDLSDVAAAGYGLRSFMNTINDPNADPDQVTAALVGLAVGLGVHVGQGGLYDYQRQGNLLTGFTQQPQFRDVSNFNVGLVGQQAGMSLPQLLTVAGGFAQGFSSNYSPSQPYGLAPQTYAWIVTGWTVGNLGYFGH